MFALLQDGFARAQSEVASLERLQVLNADALQYLEQTKAGQFDAIYLDPMYPENKKTALAKKEMQILHAVIGTQETELPKLFELARKRAGLRVVIKRPLRSPMLFSPTYSYESKLVRYDMYRI